MIETLATYWNIAPLRWSVYLVAALALSYVVAAKLYGWAIADGKITLLERIVVAPFVLLLGLLSWAVNWTVAPVYWWDSGPSWPIRWNEPFTSRLQRTLDHPQRYPARVVWIARKLKPWMNRHHPGHLR